MAGVTPGEGWGANRLGSVGLEGIATFAGGGFSCVFWFLVPEQKGIEPLVRPPGPALGGGGTPTPLCTKGLPLPAKYIVQRWHGRAHCQLGNFEILPFHEMSRGPGAFFGIAWLALSCPLGCLQEY